MGPTVFLSLFLIPIAFLYNQFTMRIPTRLAHDQAPKSSFGLIPVGPGNLPAGAGGIEWAIMHHCYDGQC